MVTIVAANLPKVPGGCCGRPQAAARAADQWPYCQQVGPQLRL